MLYFQMTGQIIKILFLKAVLLNLVLAQEETAQENVLYEKAEGKVLPVFQIGVQLTNSKLAPQILIKFFCISQTRKCN